MPEQPAQGPARLNASDWTDSQGIVPIPIIKKARWRGLLLKTGWAGSNQLFWITMLGKAAEWSLALVASLAAVLRAISR